jgi:hypothetical protein
MRFVNVHGHVAGGSASVAQRAMHSPRATRLFIFLL